MDGPAPKRRSSEVGRSVDDYSSEEELRQALEAVEIHPPDWKLPVPDPEAEEQTLDGELLRLWTLKSYLLLDAEKEQAFDRLTEEARHLYNVPTSLISLVDLGRQVLVSGIDNGAARETPRSVAFCAHTILSKNGICVVGDTLEDDRFKANKLVTEPPFLRFYAGAPLISPEGYKLGTFCVEGPEPRPNGLSPAEQSQLKQFAARTVDLMVQRRAALQERLNQPIRENLRRHAAVTTNLGGIVYRHGECVAAMKLFQESVQSLMYVEDEGGDLPTADRQEEMAQLLNLLSPDNTSPESRKALVARVLQLTNTVPQERATASGAGPMADVCRTCVIDGIPGLFSDTSRLKGPAAMRHSSGLVFGEAFQISLEETSDRVDFRNFIIPLDQCSKATLFNMGLIQYHWGNPDSAMQFFDLAASLSKANTPLAFDPVVLGCLNNMAQINLQYGRPGDAMELLADSLTRGNAALAALYSDCDRPDVVMTDTYSDQDIKSRRLRRKLARTVMNMGQVHFVNCDYEASMNTCLDAMRLLHTTNFEDMEAAAAWFNIGVLHHHMGQKEEALLYLDKFIDRARELVGPTHQVADALHRKGRIVFEMGNLYECMKSLNEALTIRKVVLGEQHESVAESLCLIGKVLQAREEYDFALNALQEALTVMKSQPGFEMSLETAQTLLELGRAHHVQGNREEALLVYTEVVNVARNFFGERHPFVARILNVLGNIQLESGNVDESLKLFADAMKMHIEQGVAVDLKVVNDPFLGCHLPRHTIAPTA